LGTSYRVLAIDDVADITDILAEVSQDAGYEVRCVNDASLIKRTYREFKPHVIFLDLDLGFDGDFDLSEPGFDGLAILQFLSEVNCRAFILLVSGMDQAKRQMTRDLGREMKLNVVSSIPKPFSIEKIEQVLVRIKGELDKTGGN